MDHTRHIAIFNANQFPVTLIGAGGIGSFTAVVLAKMGVPELTLCDPDEVDEVNLPTQLHQLVALGTPKVYALGELVNRFSDDTHVMDMCGKVDASTHAYYLNASIIISAVDSIQSRKEVWEVVKQAKFMWYLDARMSAETFKLYAVPYTDWEWYENVLALQDDASIPDEPCTSKATIYTAAIAAGQIGLAVRKIITGLPLPKVFAYDILEGNIAKI